MKTRSTFHHPLHARAVIAILALAAASLACSLPQLVARPAAPTADPAVQQTGQALVAQATVLAGREATVAQQEIAAAEKAAAESAARQTAAAVPTATPIPPATETPQPPTAAPTQAPPTSAPAEPTPDIEAQLKEAKILVYEDTQPIGYWIKQALDSGGYKYTHVGDAVGHFMEYLDSGIDWDLIIVGAESKSGVRGEFWDAIGDQVNRDAALIAEIWYLDKTVNGRIKPLLTSCGIDYQKDLPLADSIYWLEPTHTVFNEPNTALPLLHYSRHWANQAGDLIKLRPGGDAVLLAGTQKTRPTDYGQIATCMEGRVIFQTFSNHDYPRADILVLWQNYIDYTLRNHFAAEED